MPDVSGGDAHADTIRTIREVIEAFAAQSESPQLDSWTQRALEALDRLAAVSVDTETLRNELARANEAARQWEKRAWSTLKSKEAAVAQVETLRRERDEARGGLEAILDAYHSRDAYSDRAMKRLPWEMKEVALKVLSAGGSATEIAEEET